MESMSKTWQLKMRVYIKNNNVRHIGHFKFTKQTFFSHIILKNTKLHAQGNKIFVQSENKANKA